MERDPHRSRETQSLTQSGRPVIIYDRERARMTRFHRSRGPSVFFAGHVCAGIDDVKTIPSWFWDTLVRKMDGVAARTSVCKFDVLRFPSLFPPSNM